MKTFKELCDGKVWRAVEAMVIGLETQDKRKDFIVDMSTFGEAGTDTCFGCAATCTIQQLSSVNFTPDSVGTIINRARRIDVTIGDLVKFERAIDDLRLGMPYAIFSYMDADLPEIFLKSAIDFLPDLNSNNWHESLPKYKVLLRYLKMKNI